MKESDVAGSIQLTRIHAIQWYGFCDSFDLAGQTIITGVYGCGKTGLIDLIQTVLLGHPERENRYNLSLAEIGSSGREEKRDLRGYCLQDLGIKEHGQPVYARNSSRTYIALEFTWPDQKRRETWGLRIEYTSIGADADISYWKVPVRLDFSDFLEEDDVPKSAEAWNALLHKQRERPFSSKLGYLESICASQHLNFNARVFKPLLIQTLQFRFGKDFTEFCRNHILPEDPIDLDSVRESYDHYRDLVERMHLLEDQEAVLKRIHTAFLRQKEIRDEIDALEWWQQKIAVSEARSAWEFAEANWTKLHSAFEAWQIRSDGLHRLSQDAEQHLAAGFSMLRSTPNAEEFEAITKRQSDLPKEIQQLQTMLDDPVAAFHAMFDRLQELWRRGGQALSDYGWSKPIPLPILPEELPSDLNADSLSYHISELHPTVDTLASHFHETAKSLETTLRNVEGRAKMLVSEIDRLKESIIAEELPLHKALISKFGPHSVQLIGGLCTILDDQWTDALELNFSHKFSSIVPDEVIGDAFELLNSLQHPDARERLLTRRDMSALPGTARAGSLAEKITSSEPAIRQLLSHLFGEVICCQTVGEAEAHPQSALPNGTIKLLTGRGRTGAAPSEYAIGEAGRIRMSERKQTELAKINSEIEEVTPKARSSRDLAEGFKSIKSGLLQLAATKIRPFRELEKKHSELREIEERLSLFENREDLEKLRSDLISRAEAAQSAARAIRDHNKNEPADASNAKQESSRAKETFERRELAWLRWQGENSAKIEAASRHNTLEEEIALESSRERPGSIVCDLLISRRQTALEKTQAEIRSDRLGLKQNPKFTDYRDIDESDFDNNAYYDRKLAYISDTGIKDLKGKAQQAELDWEDMFQKQVLGQLQNRINEIQETFRGLRRITSGRLIGGTSYDFSYQSVNRSDIDRMRQLAADLETDNLLPPGEKLEAIKTSRRTAMESLTIPTLSDRNDLSRIRQVSARVSELLDARYYFTYDMQITESGRTESISLSQRGRKGSGGETYNPYFIALTTAYLRAFHRHINKGRPSISLLLMDEAFKVLNSEAVRDCVKIIHELGLQGVISCTDTNGGQIVEFFQWAMIVQKRIVAGGAVNGHDLIENTVLSAHPNAPEIHQILDDIVENVSA